MAACRAPAPRVACASCACWSRSSVRSRRARVLRASDRAPGLALDDEVVLPHDVSLGAGVVIHAGTVLGAGVRIEDGAVLGKAPALGKHSSASSEEPPPL